MADSNIMRSMMSELEESSRRTTRNLESEFRAADSNLADSIYATANQNDTAVQTQPKPTYVEVGTKSEIPFEILADYTGDTPTVYVRNGGFYDDTKFAGTDASSSFETFDYMTLSAAFAAGNSVWASLIITISTGAWSAVLSNARQTASSGERVISVLIGTIGANGEVLQTITGHIPIIGEEPDEESIDRNGPSDVGLLQIYDWDGAPTGIAPSGADLFPFNVNGGGGLLEYSSMDLMAAYVESVYPTYVPPYPIRNPSLPWPTHPVNMPHEDLIHRNIDANSHSLLYWLIGGDWFRNSTKSIGDDNGNKAIDVDNRQLEFGDWAVTAGNFDVAAGGVYKHEGVSGVTGDGFSGGIKTDDSAFQVALESKIQNILAGIGGLL